MAYLFVIVRHRERVRAYKQEEAKKRLKNKMKDDKDVLELLDALELQEEEDELNRYMFVFELCPSILPNLS